MRKIVVLFMVFVAVVLVLGCAPAAPSETKGPPLEPYRVGIAAGLTGPMAESYVDVTEGLRIYLERLNDAGGVNGRKIEFTIEDDQNSASQTVVAFKKILSTNPHLVALISLSPTIRAAFEAVKEAGVPALWHVGDAIEAAPPDPSPLIFGIWCGTFGGDKPGYTSGYSPFPDIFSEFVAPASDKKFGVATIDTPTGQHSAKILGGLYQQLGYGPSEIVIHPVTILDLTPIAQKLVDAKVVGVTNYGLMETGIALEQALRKLGWDGWYQFMIADSHDKWFERFKGNEKVLLVMGGGAPFKENTAEHQEMIKAATKYGATARGGSISGWAAGRIIEKVFSQVKEPSKEAVLSALNNFEMTSPTKGKIKWTAKDHIGYTNVICYKWSAEKGDWIVSSTWQTLYPDRRAKISPWWK